MAGFSEGLLSGLRGAGQQGYIPSDPRMQNPLQAAGIGNPLLQQFGQSMAGLFGKDMRSPMQIQEDQTKQALSGLATASPQQKLEIANKLIQAGSFESGSKLMQQAQEELATQAAQLQEQRAREVYSSRLRELGLEAQADLIATGAGDLKEAQKTIADEEKRRVLAKGGRRARIAMAKQAGLGNEFIQDIAKGKLDDTSDSAFADLLSGNEGELKVFLGPDNKARPYKVGPYAKVLDETTGNMVNPSELGLTQAPVVQKVYQEGNALTEQLLGKGVVRFDQLATDATNANRELARIDDIENLLNEGIFTGAGAEIKTGIVKIAVAFGLPTDTALAQNAQRTEEFVASQLSGLAAIINQYGQGNAISDKDVENAMRQIAANPTVGEQAIRNIISRARDAVRNTKVTYDKVYSKLKESGVSPAVLSLFEIPESSVEDIYSQSIRQAPQGPKPELSPSALQYLQPQGVPQ